MEQPQERCQATQSMPILNSILVVSASWVMLEILTYLQVSGPAPQIQARKTPSSEVLPAKPTQRETRTPSLEIMRAIPTLRATRTPSSAGVLGFSTRPKLPILSSALLRDF